MGRAMSLAPHAVGHIPRGDPTGTRQRGHHPPVKGRGPLSCPQSRSPPPSPGATPAPRAPFGSGMREPLDGEQNALSAPVPSAYLQIRSIWGP